MSFVRGSKSGGVSVFSVDADKFVSPTSDQARTAKYMTLPLFCNIKNKNDNGTTCEGLLSQYGENCITDISKINDAIKVMVNDKPITWKYKSDLHFLITSIAFRIMLTDCDNAPLMSWHECSQYDEGQKQAHWTMFFNLRQRLLHHPLKTEYSMHLFVSSNDTEVSEIFQSVMIPVCKVSPTIDLRRGTVGCVFYISLGHLSFVICSPFCTKEELEEIMSYSEFPITNRVHEIIYPSCGNSIVFTDKELFILPKFMKEMRDNALETLQTLSFSINSGKYKEILNSIPDNGIKSSVFEKNLVVRLPPARVLAFIDEVPHLPQGNQSPAIGQLTYGEDLELVYRDFIFRPNEIQRLYLKTFVIVYAWLFCQKKLLIWCLVLNCVNEDGLRIGFCVQFSWENKNKNRKESLHRLRQEMATIFLNNSAESLSSKSIQDLIDKLSMQPMQQTDWENISVYDASLGSSATTNSDIAALLLFSLLNKYYKSTTM